MKNTKNTNSGIGMLQFERNDWLEENGHSYIKDMSKDKIEWDLVRGDEIGMRNIDLWVSAIAVLAFAGYLFWFLNSRENSKKYAYLHRPDSLQYSLFLRYNHTIEIRLLDTIIPLD